MSDAMSFQIAQVANVTTVDGVNIFYRHAGSPENPALLLLHGFPTSSHMFRNLIPILALSFFVVAPDLPGFGFTTVPENYVHTFDNMGLAVSGFLDALEISRFAMYVFDYGAPAGMRVALQRPESVAAIITQNGNAYEEGFVPESWAAIFRYWETGAQQERDALRGDLTFDITKLQYTEGSPRPDLIQPETFFLDQALLDRPGNNEIQLDLFLDYQTNVQLYPQFQEYFRTSGVPILAAWGANDIFFLPAGAEAYQRDAQVFELHLLNASHFALETNEAQIAGLIQSFLEKNVAF